MTENYNNAKTKTDRQKYGIIFKAVLQKALDEERKRIRLEASNKADNELIDMLQQQIQLLKNNSNIDSQTTKQIKNAAKILKNGGISKEEKEDIEKEYYQEYLERRKRELGLDVPKKKH